MGLFHHTPELSKFESTMEDMTYLFSTHRKRESLKKEDIKRLRKLAGELFIDTNDLISKEDDERALQSLRELRTKYSQIGKSCEKALKLL